MRKLQRETDTEHHGNHSNSLTPVRGHFLREAVEWE